MNILAVDRDKDRLLQTDAVLRAVFQDDTVLCFTDPAKALQYGWRNTAGMVFTSLFPYTPTTGLQLAMGIRRHNKNVKVYMLLEEREYAGMSSIDAAQAGVDGCLMHPLTKQILQML